MTTDRDALRDVASLYHHYAIGDDDIIPLHPAVPYDHCDDPLCVRARAALAAEPPALHVDDDPHHYELKCVVCGQLGNIRVTIEPESPIKLKVTA